MDKFYVVPLVLIFENESILLVKQNYGNGYWGLPGGALEYNETLHSGAVRETLEETGFKIEIVNIVGYYTNIKDKALNVLYLGKIICGDFTHYPNEEIVEAGFFSSINLPKPHRSNLPTLLADYYNGVFPVYKLI